MTKVAIVTGNTSGLGEAISDELIARGWTVVGVARGNHEASTGTFNGSGLRQVQGSVDTQETVDAAFNAATDAGELSLVVNCAGQGCFGEVGSYSASDITSAISGNLAGLMLFSDKAIDAMKDSGGNIVNIMSTAAKKYRAAESVYTAVKWGAKAYTRTIRDAIKSKKYGIRVFEVYPCGMSTDFWSSSIRPVTDGSGFPEPQPIAKAVVDAVMKEADSYQQELTFERS